MIQEKIMNDVDEIKTIIEPDRHAPFDCDFYRDESYRLACTEKPGRPLKN